MKNNKNIFLGIALLLFMILIALAVDTYSRRVAVTIDPDTHQKITHSELVDKRVLEDGDITLLSGSSIFDSGMTPDEFITLKNTVADYLKEAYPSKYSRASISEDSVRYSEDEKKFSIVIRLGDEGSKKYVNAVIIRKRYNILTISIFDNNDRTYHKENVKINKRL